MDSNLDLDGSVVSVVVHSCLCGLCRVVTEAEHLSRDGQEFFGNFHCF